MAAFLAFIPPPALRTKPRSEAQVAGVELAGLPVAEVDPIKVIVHFFKTSAKKIALIERSNPSWSDLSENWGKPIGWGDGPKATHAAEVATADPSLRSG